METIESSINIVNTMNSENSTIKKACAELVPPDGEWAYVIWIAVVINFIVTSAFHPSMGMIFNDFYIEQQMDSTDIQLLHGVHSISVAISSFLTGPLAKIMSMRKLFFLSSTLLNAGAFCVIFVNSEALLFLCQATQGIGVGMLYNVTCTSVNDYFLKKRFFVTNFAQAINAAAAMAVPMAVHWTAETYGFRGTLIVISAISLQTFVGSALIHPVKWHKKKVYITPGRESIELLEKGRHHIEKDVLVMDLEQPKLVQSNITPQEVKDDNISDVSSVRRGGALAKISNIFDWPFLKKYLRTCACLGLPLSLISDVMFTTFLPQALYAYNWEKGQVAWGLSILAFGDLAARVVFILASAWLVKLGNRLIYIIGMAVDVVAKLGAVRDATGDYSIMFHVLIAIMAAVTFAWSIEIYHQRKKKNVIMSRLE